MIIGIASQDVIRARARAIARGEHKPAPDGPKIWFTSMRSLAETFLDENRALLKLIRGANPSLSSDLPNWSACNSNQSSTPSR